MTRQPHPRVSCCTLTTRIAIVVVGICILVYVELPALKSLFNLIIPCLLSARLFFCCGVYFSIDRTPESRYVSRSRDSTWLRFHFLHLRYSPYVDAIVFRVLERTFRISCRDVSIRYVIWEKSRTHITYAHQQITNRYQFFFTEIWNSCDPRPSSEILLRWSTYTIADFNVFARPGSCSGISLIRLFMKCSDRTWIWFRRWFKISQKFIIHIIEIQIISNWEVTIIPNYGKSWTSANHRKNDLVFFWCTFDVKAHQKWLILKTTKSVTEYISIRIMIKWGQRTSDRTSDPHEFDVMFTTIKFTTNRKDDLWFRK